MSGYVGGLSGTRLVPTNTSQHPLTVGEQRPDAEVVIVTVAP
jgi:hypothetical protein